jgi:DNA-binding transcriptional MerR regulator
LTLPQGQPPRFEAMEDLIPIGQFATASWLSLKALRLYDENGLLPPARVDPDSGYRFYRLDQLRNATLIRLLRDAGMPLVEIRRVLAEPGLARIDEYEASLVDELAGRRRILAYVRTVLKEEQVFEVQTKTLGPFRYVSRTAHVRVAELPRHIEQTVKELRSLHDATGPDFVVYHGEVNEDADGPVEVALPADDGGHELPATEVAFTVAEGDDTKFPAILGAYDAVASWAKSSGRELAGPPLEINHYGEGMPLRIEIAWPIR